MSEQDRSLYAMSLQNVTQVHELIGRLFRVAEPGAIYGEPIVSGDRTVVVTSELSMTVGAGVGFGHSETSASGQSGTDNGTDNVTDNGNTSGGRREAKDETGGGGGGGGFSFGRPVAAVVIEPNGVRVEPIVDPTKLGIAFFTTLGAMFFAWTQLRRASDQVMARQLATNKRAASKLESMALRAARREAKRAAKQAAREVKLAARDAKRAAKGVAKDAAKEAAKLVAKDAG